MAVGMLISPLLLSGSFFLVGFVTT